MNSSRHIRVGIDGRALQGRRAGIGRYVFELCRALDAEMSEARFFIYSHVPVEMPVVSSRWTLRVEKHSLFRAMRSFLWLKTRAGALCRKDKIDVFWGCASFFPRLLAHTRRVLTVYDLNYRLVPDTMHTAAVWQYRLFFEHELTESDYVLAISKGTAQRLVEHFGRGADAVVYPAVSPMFKRQSEDIARECIRRLGLTFPYIFAVATWEPRKNLELLVKTFLKMKASGELGDHRLVLAGGRGWKDERLLAMVGGDQATHIVPLGYVPDEDLPMLYSGADAFVFPSVYEGFGMPVLEARTCGARVVATDIPELREAGGDGAIYIQPTLEGIRAGILDAVRDQRRQVQEGISPTWREGARTLAAALRGGL